MKLARTLIAIAALSAAALAQAQPADADDCAQKQAGLTSEMENAQSAGKDARAVSLERARGELAVSCSEPGERAMRERRISTQEKKVTQLQKAVDDAAAKGNGAAKEQADLKEAKAELQRMKRAAPTKQQAQHKGSQQQPQAPAAKQ